MDIIDIEYDELENQSDKVMVVGHPYANTQAISDLLKESGINPSQKSKNNRLSAAEITRTILKLRKQNNSSEKQIASIWDSLILDLYLGNMDNGIWFWEDSEACELLDYYKSVDGTLSFLLVYNTPQQALMNFISQRDKKLKPKHIDKFLKEWIAYNEELLKFFYRNQDRALLINSDTLHKTRIKQLKKLSKKIGLPISVKKQSKHTNITTHHSQIKHTDKQLHHLLAKTIEDEYPDVSALYNEMQSVANVYDATTPSKTVGMKHAFCEIINREKERQATAQTIETLTKEKKGSQEQLLKEKKAKEALAKEKEHQEKEKEQILSQLMQVQEELEKYYHEVETKQKLLQATTQKVENLSKEQKGSQEQLLKEKKAKEALAKEKERQEKEKEQILSQLMQVQEELEKYYLANQSLKQKVEEEKRYYGAAERIKQQLSYRLGAKMIENSKSFWGIITLPFSLLAVRNQYKKDMKNRTEKLPPIETYADAYDAERVKEHLSYRLGQTTIQTLKNPFGLFILPFKLQATYKAFKEDRK